MKLRRRAALKWTGASLCALIFAVWFASRWYWCSAGYRRPRTELEILIGAGQIVIERDQRGDAGFPNAGWWYNGYRQISAQDRHWDWRPKWIHDSSGPQLADGIMVPLYAPFAMLALPSAWLFYRDRRHERWARAGRCVGCGYDLSGLPPGAACPECGKGAN